MVNIFLQLTTKKDSEQKLIAIRKKKIFQQLELRIAKKARKAKKNFEEKNIFILELFHIVLFQTFTGH